MTAIYTRQSIDKKDSLSIESQIEICKKELLPGDEFTVYRDKGFSGKNIDRPSFARLLSAVESGSVNKIIVYRLDRISRSITDFAGIIDLLEEHKVDFVSTSEKFDTSTPVGRAMLYIIMVFAQLERETIAERIRDNYYSRGKTGVWLGGPAPFGFDNAKTAIGGKTVSTIIPNSDLDTVREIFNLYAAPGASLASVARVIRTRRDDMWNSIKVARILHNPAYVRANADIYNYYQSKKCIVVNGVEEFDGVRGCNLYGKRDRGSNKYRLTPEHVLSLARHEGVIEPVAWLMCQRKLDNNKQLKNSGKGKHTWLSGLMKCGYCGYSMGVKVSGNVKYIYCAGRYSSGTCLPDRLSTHYVSEVEDFVFHGICARVERLKGMEVPRSEQNSIEVNQLKQQLAMVEQQIERLLEGIASGNDVLIEYANKKIVELDARRIEVLEGLNQSASTAQKIEIPNISNWDTLDLSARHIIAERMIEKVQIFNDKIEVLWQY